MFILGPKVGNLGLTDRFWCERVQIWVFLKLLLSQKREIWVFFDVSLEKVENWGLSEVHFEAKSPILGFFGC